MTTRALDGVALRKRVQRALDTFLAQRQSDLTSISADLLPLLDALRELLSGGKRLRPAFAYWGAVGAGGDDSQDLVTACASLELFQACALIHDDVMDGSDTRRGKPSVHRRFEAAHLQAGWGPSHTSYGVAAAILLGDLCLGWASDMLQTCGLPAPDLERARPIYADMRTEVTVGQYLDVLEQARGGGTLERALHVVRFKSAKYTVERPLHLGGALAGATPRLLADYSRFALPLGEAFQLRDDLLGVFGDPVLTGKPAGDDLREGKRTALIAAAHERANAKQAALLQSLLGDPALTDSGVTTLQQVLRDTGAHDRIEAMVAGATEQALRALSEADIEASARAALQELAVAATTRVT